MKDLINLVAQKAGISPDQAKSAVETVLGYVKSRLPEPLAAQLDGAIGDPSGDGRSMGDAIKHLRSVMGGS